MLFFSFCSQFFSEIREVINKYISLNIYIYIFIEIIRVPLNFNPTIVRKIIRYCMNRIDGKSVFLCIFICVNEICFPLKNPRRNHVFVMIRLMSIIILF